jgi:pimeloyl-ACP methyl ester carboxylesterase
MPFAHLSDVDINYQVIGDIRPSVALVSRGRVAMGDSEELARRLADQGCRVLIHDRRNCGRSSFDLRMPAPEEELWARDLAALMRHVGMTPAVVLGWSRGARVAIRLALYHPDVARGLVLWGLSGGPAAVRFLEDYYFLKPMRAVATGRMDAVCAGGHFEDLLADDPSKGPQVRSLEVERFIESIDRQRRAFLVDRDQTVMGVSDGQLRALELPVVVAPYYDRMHPHGAVLHARALIRESQLVDYDPARRATKTTHLPEDEAIQDQFMIARIMHEFMTTLESGDTTRGGHGHRGHRTWRSTWRAVRGPRGSVRRSPGGV